MKNKLLTILKECDGFISGEEIGERLGVSRTAVWKNISKLKSMGYQIEAVTNKGYRLIENEIDIINEAEIKDGLNTSVIGNEIYYFNEVESTNDEIRKLGENGYKEGVIVIAETQTNGKGRRGRAWTSPKYSGIWMSMLLTPEIAPIEAPRLTLVAGLCMCKAIRDLTGLSALIKWPNDILINGKKVCGILTEMSAEIESVNYIILGIGVNVNNNEFPEELKDIASSLKIEGNINYQRKKIIKCFLEYFEKYYFNFIKDNNFSAFVDEYKKYSATLGKEVTVIGRENFNAEAIDINDDGELVVKKEDGSILTVFSGEVSVRSK